MVASTPSPGETGALGIMRSRRSCSKRQSVTRGWRRAASAVIDRRHFPEGQMLRHPPQHDTTSVSISRDLLGADRAGEDLVHYRDRFVALGFAVREGRCEA